MLGVFFSVNAAPTVIDYNITDGSLTLFNGSTMTNYFLDYASTITVYASLSNDSAEPLTAAFLYCAADTDTNVLDITNASTTSVTLGGSNPYSYSVSIPSACKVDGQKFTFSIGINDSNNVFVMYNDTVYVNSTINPKISSINLTYTFTDSDGGSATKTITDLTNTYVAAKNLTFNVEVSGEQKSTRLIMFFNNESYTISNLGNGQFGHVNVSVAFVNLTEVEDIAAATVGLFEGSVDATGWADNTSAEFYIVANNTGDNYTYIAGPYRFQVDLTKPSVSITEPSDLTINPRDSITYKCEGSDSGAGVYMYKFTLTKPDSTTTSTSFSTSDEATFSGDDTSQFGTYTVKCTVLDYAGNEESATSGDSETFRVISSLSSYSTSGGGGEEVGVPAFDIDLSTSESGEVKALQGAVKKFTLDGTTEHTMTFVAVTSNSVTLEFASDPVSVTLNVGDTKEVDIDGDGKNDLSVKLVSVINSKADVIINRAAPPVVTPPAEQPPAETPPAEQPPAAEQEVVEEEAGTAWIWIVLLIVLVVLVVGYFLLRKKKQQ
ncbi:MAG: hypothetical protein QW404_01965 [Candidatus Nanoarchaeia archaeon]